MFLTAKKHEIQEKLVFTSWQELHDEVKVCRVLEAVVHLHHPLVVGLHQDVPLSPHVGNLNIVRIRSGGANIWW